MSQYLKFQILVSMPSIINPNFKPISCGSVSLRLYFKVVLFICTVFLDISELFILFTVCFYLLGNHKGIAQSLGYKSIREYKYWDDAKRKLDIDGMLDDLKVKTFLYMIFWYSCRNVL